MQGERATGRTVYSITGSDRLSFLQGLVTNDVARLKDGLVYAALLTPQGKYLADFFLVPRRDAVLLDVDQALSAALAQRLAMYRLRADVTIVPTEITITRGLGSPPEGAFPDPRDPALGWRDYEAGPGAEPRIEWDAIRVDAGVPQSGIELVTGETFILEAGFERLSGVDFHKGCYVGQEVTARMKHKAELRKGLAVVSVRGTAPAGTEITAGGKTVGTLYTQSGDKAIAYLRFDRARGRMLAGDAQVTWRG